MEEKQNQTPQFEPTQNQESQYATAQSQASQSRTIPQNETAKNRGAAHIASLVLGIISIVGSGFLYIALPTGILAIILGVKSAKKTGSKLGKAGMITGIVGLSILALLYITVAIGIFVDSL